ncbi:MAG: cytochrome-c oxidase [Gammaproteobacteria bacterium RIFCSPLOWO2_02_FULL_47_50]|jgi:cytochrome c oxidase cbb3-type subunit 4|nr:MAG: cytochrome-c oxidase [Gammaproteobacteria bacterium RIFCSPLOWO2_01_FULL_47_190]OGT78911.1 MAG: cytochrome-c oxidase [Gammaproteobacteria bacterium RIFCSPLOWO2_02_FULL_47_50]OGT87587.1 MAG: cytochrome-c oxidase [Gammaproteobacteria bacterium RIFCSPLOWO2_12_FULL_47_76]
MDFGFLQGLWTIIVMIFFLGVVVWAWSKKRKKEFDEAAMIPFREDNDDIIREDNDDIINE